MNEIFLLLEKKRVSNTYLLNFTNLHPSADDVSELRGFFSYNSLWMLFLTELPFLFLLDRFRGDVAHRDQSAWLENPDSPGFRVRGDYRGRKEHLYVVNTLNNIPNVQK